MDTVQTMDDVRRHGSRRAGQGSGQAAAQVLDASPPEADLGSGAGVSVR